MTAARQAGFSLVEVLVTLVVLGMGLIAVAKFQGNVVENGALAKARTVAAHLAQEKLDDLRIYDMLAPPTSATPPATSVFYSSIASNAGGERTASGALMIPSGSLEVASVSYRRNWTVTDYYFPLSAPGTPTPNTAASTTVPAILATTPQYPDFKRVIITVDWTDQDGKSQSVTLPTIISAHDPLYSGRALEQ
ncbi:MAG TPA: prepilin-type N-terminal cleavage/methylation domain-containing protein [Gammaproteobacteria bacterium]|nr:prepilin-type N-terminal cleavage/methylation domain-containing protein [Gammaproteobacteria bacterium]